MNKARSRTEPGGVEVVDGARAGLHAAGVLGKRGVLAGWQRARLELEQLDDLLLREYEYKRLLHRIILQDTTANGNCKGRQRMARNERAEESNMYNSTNEAMYSDGVLFGGQDALAQVQAVVGEKLRELLGLALLLLLQELDHTHLDRVAQAP